MGGDQARTKSYHKDAEEIRLLLKEQATTQQQQADAFHDQVAALYAELQATRTLIQSRQGGMGDMGSPIPRSMRLDVPKFFGNDPDINAWGTDISADLLITFYVSGLKPSLQCELLVVKPTSLGDDFSLVRVTEARLEDQWVGNNSGVAPLSIKWISPAERPDRLSKGLCFNCDNKSVRGHKCPGKFLLLIADKDEVTRQSGDGEQDDAMESGDISILNSLVGHGSPRPWQLWGTLESRRVHILIANGSTHNFVHPGVVERMHLPITDIQGLRMDVDLYVLPMKGPDIVLGIQWLQKLGKVTHDYLIKTMEFTWLDQGKVLEGFQREQGLLLFQGRYFIGAQSKLKEVLLSEFLDTLSAGHEGSKKMLVGLATLFYWKRMRRSVVDFIKRSTTPMGTFITMGEYSYNISFHSSIKMTPYQALYGRVPPSIILYSPGSSKVAAVDEGLVERDVLL
ncbi:reverse transcriptase [Tanacetum coccineum]